MALNIKVNSNKTLFTVRVHSLNQTAKSTKENGRAIKCMELVHSLGQMVVNMKVNTKTISNGVMVSLLGQIRRINKSNEYMKGIGR